MALAVTSKDTNNKIHSWKFGLYVAFAAMIMMFASLTSAYIVRQAAGNWQEFRLPNLFFINTLVILLSSASLQYSYSSFKKENERDYKLFMLITFVLGITFVVLQYQGWQALTDIGILVNGNPAGSFIYVISGLHVAHVLGGLAALTVALSHAFGLKFRPTPHRKLRFELTLQYWHFVGLLWLYLIVFFMLSR
ncbi:MAG: hypothetical protein RLZZ292_2850 [Bacteroidota bacterium]|jgi:cytochrome c oxidase subunit 3